MDWWHWHTEPELIGGLLLITWLYAVYTGPLRSRLAPNEPYPLRAAAYFYTGLVLFYLTVGSPLDFLGEVFLFSAHMGQHIMLMYVVPILLIMGLPDWLTRPILSRRIPGALARFFTRPLVAGGLFIFTLSAWHVPSFYEASLQNRLIHNFEHVTMFGGGLIVWWLIFARSQVVPALSRGPQILFIFVVSLGKIPLASFLVFSGEVLYLTYEYAPRLTEMSALEDQVLGGVMMALTAKFIGMFLIGYSFYQWNKENAEEEAAFDELPKADTA